MAVRRTGAFTGVPKPLMTSAGAMAIENSSQCRAKLARLEGDRLQSTSMNLQRSVAGSGKRKNTGSCTKVQVSRATAASRPRPVSLYLAAKWAGEQV